LNSVTGAQIVQVDGFPAVESSSSLADPDKQCLLYVDVAPGTEPRGPVPERRR
jgi:hypothetical protein